MVFGGEYVQMKAIGNLLSVYQSQSSGGGLIMESTETRLTNHSLAAFLSVNCFF